MNKINKLLTPYNFTNKNDTGRIKYLVIHYVGATGGAEANCKYYAGKYIGASAHYFVGFSGEIWQSVEDGDIAWHCGASSYKHPECRNTNSIGIELCVRNKGSQAADSRDWYFEDATVRSGVELTRHLMQKYNIDAAHVIRHHDVTGKICPNPYVYNHTDHVWDEFKRQIVADGAITENKPEEPNAEFDSYQIQTTCNVLNIRSGAGTGCAVTGKITESDGAKRTYTIVNEQNGWGQLENGAGWISLSYTRKISGTGQESGAGVYMIQTTCDVLNIRSGAGTGYGVVGTITEPVGKKNRYTITEEKSGWGRLKSGAGWISLAYTQKVS